MLRRKNGLFTYLSLAACVLACLALLAPDASAQKKTTRRGRRHTPARVQAPLTKDYLLGALRSGRPTQKTLVALMKSRGVDFQPTEEDEAQLRKAGATHELLETVSKSYMPPPVLAPTTNTFGSPRASRPSNIADPSLLPPGSESGPGMGTGRGGGIGAGRGGGIGTGEGTGIGSGSGGDTDYGPGRGSNAGSGGGDYGLSPAERAAHKDTFTAREVTKKVVIASMPKPGYTEEARQNNVSGTVKLRVIFTVEGTVTDISVLNGLPYGLSERAVAAAKQIRFTPAEKDGHPVAQWAVIEYNFYLY